MPYRLLLTQLAALMLLGGCTQYREIPPQTAEGQACVRQCNDQARQCERRADESYQNFKGLYDTQYQSYQNCLHVTEDPQLKQMCPRPTAPSGPEYRDCSRSYDSCFVECGGTYEQIE